jgi:hypothetical protein
MYQQPSKNKTMREGGDGKQRKAGGGNVRDLGVMEWRIPVGRAERTGDREKKREMQVQTRTFVCKI